MWVPIQDFLAAKIKENYLTAKFLHTFVSLKENCNSLEINKHTVDISSEPFDVFRKPRYYFKWYEEWYWEATSPAGLWECYTPDKLLAKFLNDQTVIPTSEGYNYKIHNFALVQNGVFRMNDTNIVLESLVNFKVKVSEEFTVSKPSGPKKFTLAEWIK